MAGNGDEELEYESDPEDAKLLLKMRRREASDDEDEEDDGEERDLPSRRPDSRAGIISDYESDGQGAAADYDEDESDTDQVSAVDEEELELDEEQLNQHDGYAVLRSSGVRRAEVIDEVIVVAADTAEEIDADGRRLVGKSIEVQRLNQAKEKKADNEEFAVPIDGELYASDDQPPIDESGREGEKKENEPFAVPTAGAFYMHDDRFRDSAGGRHRRTLGGKKLWESKDNRKWGHDKFEEMTMEETNYDKGRNGPRGRYRGRGKSRGENRGYPQGIKSSNTYNNNNAAPKSVRGRGPRRYQPSQNYREASTQNRQTGNSASKSSYASSERASVAASSKNESDPVLLSKNVFASSLNSASPPFYPSGSSTKESTSYYVQKRDVQLKSAQGKNVVADSIGMEKLYIDDSIPIPHAKPLSNLQLPPPVSSLINSTEFPQSKIQGRGMTNSSYQTAVPLNQIGRVTPSTQRHNNVQRPTVRSQFQPSSQGSRSQASSPPKTALSASSIDSGEVESLPRSGLVGKGNSVQSSDGRSGFPYSGGQAISGGGDRNFPGAPAFLPVMQFGGQHPGGMGVPAVGMAFPGYVAQPQLGMGKSEMTWLPVLASAAGAMGAPYCSPYLTVEGAAYQNTSGQTSTLATISSKENIASKPANELKSSQRLELANDEFGQRQSKPRRYTEMKFDQ